MKRVFPALRTSTITCIFIVAAIGCDQGPSNPGISHPGNGDDSDNRPDSTYGTLYFRSTSPDQWITGGPVNALQGILTAAFPAGENPPVTASAELSDSLNFASSLLITFAWDQELRNSGSYTFWLGDTRTDWQEAESSYDGRHWTVQRQIAFAAPPRYCRFEFELPNDSSRVVIRNFRAFGF